jgi:predicted MFS family arabinose efflux permease
MMALVVALVGDLVPRERTGSAMGLMGTVSAVGTALGPSMGGLLIAWFGWPAVFAVMAAGAAVALLLALRTLPAITKRKPSGPRSIWPGSSF